MARALTALFDPPHTFVSLREKFHPDVADTEWIKSLDNEGGWSVLTKDLRIRTKPHERAVMDNSRILFFFIDGAWKKLGVEESTARLIRLIPNMAKLSDVQDRGRLDLPINSGSKLRPHRD